jgi:hypothetical protein
MEATHTAPHKTYSRLTQGQAADNLPSPVPPKNPRRVAAARRAAERRSFVKALDASPRYWDEWSCATPTYPVLMGAEHLVSSPLQFASLGTYPKLVTL